MSKERSVSLKLRARWCHPLWGVSTINETAWACLRQSELLERNTSCDLQVGVSLHEEKANNVCKCDHAHLLYWKTVFAFLFQNGVNTFVIGQEQISESSVMKLSWHLIFKGRG